MYEREENVGLTPKKIIGLAAAGIASLFVIVTILLTFYTIEEGYQGVVKRLGEAKEQVGPGLNWKVP